MEFEMLDGVAEMFDAAEAEAAALELGEAAAVEENAAVAGMAEGPAVEEGMAQRVNNFIESNPYANKMWQFSKWAVKAGATASAIFGVTYGLNKAIAKDAHDTGSRTGLSTYLAGLQKNFQKLGLTFGDDQKQKAAEDALAFPWIDATQ
jgi:hypothetical protein